MELLKSMANMSLGGFFITIGSIWLIKGIKEKDEIMRGYYKVQVISGGIALIFLGVLFFLGKLNVFDILGIK